jgi:hypothetical protein
MNCSDMPMPMPMPLGIVLVVRAWLAAGKWNPAREDF